MVNRYQFGKIYSQMKQEFGMVPHGDEERYAMMLLPMEGNVLKVHRRFPSSNSRRMDEAIALVLFDIKERYTGESFDTGTFRNADNERLEKALLMAFDPFTNPESFHALRQSREFKSLNISDLSDKNQLHDYYKRPVMCLLRIKDSVDLMLRENGSDGYFDFIENYMGHHIKGEDMDFCAYFSR
ncbi:MAG: hypothetical protein LUG93_01330 [Lachnospiraceae bacterium]|nr:hypothetical protein [Lachnospiraceae bacterium]